MEETLTKATKLQDPPLAERRYAIIGAGAAGLCSAKYLLEAGARDVTIYEKGSQIGGLWCYENDNGYSAAYKTLHINSAREITRFHDFPFAEGVQAFPDHRDMHRYLISYAERFDLVRRIRFNSTVISVRPASGYDPGSPRWEVETEGGEVATFDRVIVANGHLSKPLHVEKWRGAFKGEYMHSHWYRDPSHFDGKRVCIIGAGNSACDIASDICMTAEKVVLVARSGVVIAPKLMFGKPFTDITVKLDKEWIPDALRRKIVGWLVYLAHGRMTDLGFKPLKQRAHPTSNAVLVQHIAYRRISVKHEIERIDGTVIHFNDGTAETFDVLVGSTGYLLDFPFLDEGIVNVENNSVDLFKRIVPPDWPGLYFIGLVNTTTSLPNMFEHQLRWLIPIEKGEALLPGKAEMKSDIDAKKQFISKYYNSSVRHGIEEPHMYYFPELRKSLRQMMKKGERRA